MTRTKFDVNRVEIDVRDPGSRFVESKEVKKETFFEFYKVFEKYLSKYASNTESKATSQFDVCGRDSNGTPYGNNINFETPISVNTLNKILLSAENDSKFTIKKIEYFCDSKLTVVVITKLN